MSCLSDSAGSSAEFRPGYKAGNYAVEHEHLTGNASSPVMHPYKQQASLA